MQDSLHWFESTIPPDKQQLFLYTLKAILQKYNLKNIFRQIKLSAHKTSLVELVMQFKYNYLVTT